MIERSGSNWRIYFKNLILLLGFLDFLLKILYRQFKTLLSSSIVILSKNIPNGASTTSQVLTSFMLCLIENNLNSSLNSNLLLSFLKHFVLIFNVSGSCSNKLYTSVSLIFNSRQVSIITCFTDYSRKRTLLKQNSLNSVSIFMRSFNFFSSVIFKKLLKI